jgi:beta-lactamase class D OXA-10
MVKRTVDWAYLCEYAQPREELNLMIRKILLVVIFIITTQPAFSQSIIENIEWNKFFQSESVEGVFLLCKNTTQQCTTNNKDRALTTFIPASTYKIPNALIALETGVITEFEIFKWDGKPKEMKWWEHDLTLRSAIQVSAVPLFQQIAREIGERRMQKYLDKFSYGNKNIGGGIDRFWLDGELKISAINQVQFLEALYLNKLPIKQANQLIVKQALISEAAPDYLLHAKTGFSGIGTAEKAGVGWWVGWIEKGTDVYFFAFNMDIRDRNKLSVRKSIPKQILESEGVTIAGK